MLTVRGSDNECRDVFLWKSLESMVQVAELDWDKATEQESSINLDWSG